MRSLRVSIGGRTIGHLHERAGSAGDLAASAFLYDAAYVADPNRPVLSQSLLDQRARPLDVVTDDGLVAYFSNLLPEEGPLRRYLSDRHAIDRYDDFGLLAALGQNLPGAVVVEPLDGAAWSRNDGTAIASETQGSRDPYWRFSLAGVQMKFSAIFEADRWMLAPIAQPGEWIVKLPTSEYPGLVENEFAMMQLARACGLTVPATQLIDLSAVENLDERFLKHGTLGYAIRRYDRSADGRVHQEDFCQIFGRQPAAKYWPESHLESKDLLGMINELCGPEDAQTWIAALTFSVAIGNADAHLKNFAVIYPDGRTAQLAPTYDVVCVLRYEHRAPLALPIAGVSRFGALDAGDFDRLADAAGVSRRIVRAGVAAMSERLLAAWPGVRDLVSDEDTRSIVEHRITTRVPKLAATTSKRLPR